MGGLVQLDRGLNKYLRERTREAGFRVWMFANTNSWNIKQSKLVIICCKIIYLQHKMITITVIQKTVEAIMEQKVSGWGVGF